MGSIQKKLIETLDLENIQSYDLSKVVKQREIKGWIYHFMSDIGKVELTFHRFDDEKIKLICGEDYYLLAEGYEIGMLVNDKSIKGKGERYPLSVYLKILKTCFNLILEFIHYKKPQVLFVRKDHNLDLSMMDEEEKKVIEKQAQKKYLVYLTLLQKNVSKIKNYYAYTEKDGLWIKRPMTKEENEQAKLLRLDRKGLLEAYILKVLKQMED
jgi:hypothetical protein